MATRKRGILIDNTFSKMFSNIEATTNATAAQLIAGGKVSTTAIIIKPPGLAIQVVKSIQGKYFGNPGIITGATYTFNAAGTSTALKAASLPKSKPVLVTLRKVSSAGEITIINQYSLLAGVATGSINTGTVQIAVGDTFFWDVNQVGTTQPGQGLSIIMNYYTGY